MADLKSHSLTDLQRLARSLEREIAKRTESTASKVLKEATKLARAAGLELSDLIAKPPKATRAKQVKTDTAPEGVPAKRKARAKFANPADPSQKWTGRGRKPRWVEAHLAAGGQIEDLSISKQRAAAKDAAKA